MPKMRETGAGNWTKSELHCFMQVSILKKIIRKLIIQAIENRQERLFNNSGPQFKKDIDAAWDEIRSECVEAGFERFAGKSSATLRNDLWKKKKTELMKRWDAFTATGMGSNRPWEEVCF